MKHIYLVIFTLFVCLDAPAKFAHPEALEDVFSQLDRILGRRDEFRQVKEERIGMLYDRLKENTSPEERYHINKLFYEEYYVYNADSAMKYTDANLEIARRLGRAEWMYDWRIKKSFLLSATGLLKEAEEQLVGLPLDRLEPRLLTDYYGQMMYLLSHFGQYTGSENEEMQKSYLDRERMYRDSVYTVLQPTHPLYLWYKACHHQYQGEEAMRKVLPELRAAVEASTLDNRYDAMNAYALASICRDLNDRAGYQKYLVCSAMADVASCNKDIASLEELGRYMFDLGDIDRAYAYINYCLQNALFYKNRVRIMSLSTVLDRINAVYQERARLQESRLQLFLCMVSILSAVLLCAIVCIIRQLKVQKQSHVQLDEMNRRLNRHVTDLSETHDRLKQANDRLNSLNAQLKDVNLQLRESNYVKEEYIGYVFSICSNYISKLDEYRKNINRKIKANQIDEAKVLTDTPAMAQNELKEFYQNFDAIFLHVYPAFVNDFNALLRPEERIVLKEGEQLNTELRIYALVRLGINDSVKIAEFLHCSPQTVYNNRLKTRNKSDIPKGEFAAAVRALGKTAE